MNTLAQSLYALLPHHNVQAFFHVIRAGETSHEDSAYSMLFGGDAFDGFADHPRKLIRKSGYSSTAAGAYQFLSRTWDECQKALDLPDFSPLSQDLACLFLIRRRGALDDVLAGRVREAIAKCAKEWASLPGSPYGQPTKTMSQALATFQQYGGTLTSQTPGAPMAPMIPAAVSAIASVAPQLIRIFGSGSEVSERNAKAAEVVVQAAKEATGAVNEQHLIEKIESKDPAVIQTVQQVVKDVWFEISIDSGGVEAARKSFADPAVPFWKQPAIWVTAALLPMVYLVLYAVIWVDKFATQDMKALVVGSIISGLLAGITGFWLGTSFSSQRKDELRK